MDQGRGTARARPGDWVQIHSVVLSVGERSPAVPPETAAVPLELRLKGFALAEAELGAAVPVRTAAGREVRGTLVAVWPRYPHDFGEPVPELIPVGGELRAILREDPHDR